MSSYATTEDLSNLGVTSDSFEDIDDEKLQAALDSASTLADGYLASKFQLPLVSSGQDLAEAVCKIAAYNLLGSRGYNPELGGDVVLRARYDDAIRWLEGVSAGKISPAITDSSGGPAQVGGPFVLSPVQSSYDGTLVASRPQPRGW